MQNASRSDNATYLHEQCDENSIMIDDDDDNEVTVHHDYRNARRDDKQIYLRIVNDLFSEIEEQSFGNEANMDVAAYSRKGTDQISVYHVAVWIM